jgi:hypothetical protein
MAHIVADKSALGNEIRRADSPALILSEKYLQLFLDGMLNNSIQTATIALTTTVTFKNTRLYDLIQTLVDIRDTFWVIWHIIFVLRPSNRHLETLTSRFVGTVVGAITATQKIRMQI